MPVQKIPLDAVQKIRQHVQNTLVLPESENHPKSWSSYDEMDELPEPSSLGDLGSLFSFGGPAATDAPIPNTEGKWFVSAVDPGAALLKLPGLRLKPQFRLVCYLNRTANEGMGITWAVPEQLSTTAQLEEALEKGCDREHPPQPAGALKDILEAVDGDYSPASYLVASILRRELKEFGALGKSCSWSHHRLIPALPSQANWEWRTKPVQDLSPKVYVMPDNRVVIEFFTCRVVAPVAVYQHIDQYTLKTYRSSTADRVVAVPQRR